MQRDGKHRHSQATPDALGAILQALAAAGYEPVTFDSLVTGKPLGGEVGGARVWRHSGDGAPHRALQRVQAIGYHASRCLCVDRRVDAGKVRVLTQRHNGSINFLRAVWGFDRYCQCVPGSLDLGS